MEKSLVRRAQFSLNSSVPGSSGVMVPIIRHIATSLGGAFEMGLRFRSARDIAWRGRQGQDSLGARDKTRRRRSVTYACHLTVQCEGSKSKRRM